MQFFSRLAETSDSGMMSDHRRPTTSWSPNPSISRPMSLR